MRHDIDLERILKTKNLLIKSNVVIINIIIVIIDTVESEPKPRQTKVGEQIASYVEISNIT